MFKTSQTRLMMKHGLKIKKYTGGFTLVEVIIAILLLGVVVAAGASSASSGLTATFAARDQVTAFYLAQEAAELVKNRRDVNSQEGRDWLDGIIDDGGGVGSVDCSSEDCEVSAIIGVIQECEDGCVVKRNDQGFYGFEGNDTEYRRIVHVEKVSGREYEILIDVTMEWDGRDLTLREHVFDWRN